MPLRSLTLAAALLLGCGNDAGSVADAGLDAIRRLAITVDGPGTLQTTTRSVKVTVLANGVTRIDTFPVGGLPATVDVPAPIQLSMWMITIDGLDVSGTLIGRGMVTVPSGTSETAITLAAI